MRAVGDEVVEPELELDPELELELELELEPEAESVLPSEYPLWI